MPRGVAIHVGLNRVDPNAYGGWNGQLSGCVNDAQAMRAIANARGYSQQTPLILDTAATSSNVVNAILSAASTMQSGDIFFLTYSGHGGQVPDPTGTEPGGFSSTWVLYDRMVIDRELYALWAHFRQGVRIVVFSDSCHSGTVTKDLIYREALNNNPDLARAYRLDPAMRAGPPTFKNIPVDRQQAAYDAKQLMYDTISRYTPPDPPVSATVLLVSACEDNQLAADGQRNGLFTEHLLNVWRAGFQGTYRQFRDSVTVGMPPTQTPNYYVVGAPNPDFERQHPLEIGVMPGAPSGPVVSGTPGSTGQQPPSTALQQTAEALKERMHSDPWFAIRVRLDPQGTLLAAGVAAADLDAILQLLHR